MSKQKTWKGHPLYESPDGRVVTIDKDRYDTYMRTLDAADAREKRRAKRAKTAETAPAADTAAATSTGPAPAKDGDKRKN